MKNGKDADGGIEKNVKPQSIVIWIAPPPSLANEKKRWGGGRTGPNAIRRKLTLVASGRRDSRRCCWVPCAARSRLLCVSLLIQGHQQQTPMQPRETQPDLSLSLFPSTCLAATDQKSKNWKEKEKKQNSRMFTRCFLCNHNYDQTTAWLIPGWITSWIKFDFFRKRLPSPLACWKWNICGSLVALWCLRECLRIISDCILRRRISFWLFLLIILLSKSCPAFFFNENKKLLKHAATKFLFILFW